MVNYSTPLLPNIEKHNIEIPLEIPVGSSFKNTMNLNYTSQFELPPLTNKSVNLEANNNNNNNNIQCDDVSNFENKIKKWVLQYNVSRNCVNDLLGILRSEGKDINENTKKSRRNRLRAVFIVDA
ncbi:unnamed protein product [Macrosiphum euphorbiae]|uniref:LAGLIDADG homing endonuclease n=1 Tax=Macrosiphum euphorbiae TaxID=13131 RepID=A0AAV0Y2D7_9HEMI|nr:unnamed protein product [Macrosiphum euphorbiae]